MIELKDVGKFFKIPKSKKKKDLHEVDAREQGKLFHAISDITFTAQQGRILGLLGPNGAGKTTLLRILSTALKPSEGSVQIKGLDIVAHPEEARRRIGFLTGNTGLYQRLTVKEMVSYFGKLHGIRGAQLEARLKELFDLLEMSSFSHRRCGELSFGMKQKTNIARTLVHDPEIVILDEPTTGLDVAAAENILALIERCSKQGKTVLFSTHHMHEVDRLCDEVVIIDEGRICFEGDVDGMKRNGGHQALDKAFLGILAGGVSHAA